MNRPHREDGLRPFVLATDQIADLNRRAALCDHPIAQLVAVATLVPCEPYALSVARVRGFDRQNDVLVVRGPTGIPARIALGHAAAAAVRNAIGGRTKGRLVEDLHGEGIVPDRDTVDYAHELLSSVEAAPLLFEFTFRSLREGVFAGMLDGGVPADVAEMQAGLGHMGVGLNSDGLQLVQQRAASDWWAATIGVPLPTTIEFLRDALNQARWRDRPNGFQDRLEGGS